MLCPGKWLSQDFTQMCTAPKSAWPVLGQEMVGEEGKQLEDQFVSSEGERQVPAAFALEDKPEQDFPAKL